MGPVLTFSPTRQNKRTGHDFPRSQRVLQGRSRLFQRVPIWLTGVMLAVALSMIVALLGLILVYGLGALWPKPLWDITLKNGSRYLGLVHKVEPIPHAQTAEGQAAFRTLFRIGNRDLSGADFVWIDQTEIAQRRRPDQAVAVERLEWGPFYGFLQEVRTPAQTVRGDPQAVWRALRQELPDARRRLAAIRQIERRTIGDINYKIQSHRLAIKRLELKDRLETPAALQKRQHHEAAIEALEAEYTQIAQQLERQRAEDEASRVVLSAIGQRTVELPISSLVRVHRPNRLSWWGKLGVYLDRLGEFVFAQPREANSEGGVAPAIFGTVMMTLLMTIVVVPLGVLAALYLHEYAKQGLVVSTVRIAVNNLAGVPSIVFGVFGLGFFCYVIGGTIDRWWFPERLPTPTFGGGGIVWASLTLALLTVPVVIVATEEALAAVPKGIRQASLACGATKFQTIWHIVLPSAIPGILTGTILAMARGAGEVAPLMITGVVKLAPDLPIDHVAPFLHLDRKFMHLGFHIYDVGFQSPNVEASKAMVYMTTLLLITIVLCLNVAAMQIRTRLRERFRQSAV